jgi:hypothetical protein
VNDAYQRLLELGANEFPHVAGSLAPHLRRTEALLSRWGNRSALCLAGLYHAVYGTEGIRGSLVGLESRPAIAEVIGSEAEHIAYLYGACARSQFHPRIGTLDQLRFVDRFTMSEYAIAESALRDFCELTLANQLELAISSEAFRAQYGAELADFFDRMRGLVSEAGYETYRRALYSDGLEVFEPACRRSADNKTARAKRASLPDDES